MEYRDNSGNLSPVSGEFGQTSPTPVLIRNSNFARGPFPNESGFKSPPWSIEADGLPLGTIGFLVSGGHTNPVYYVYAQDSATGIMTIYKRSNNKWQ